MMPTAAPYKGITVTVPTTPTNLWSLLHAVDAGCPTSARECLLQADPTNATNILVGDDHLLASPQRCGYVISAGGNKQYREGMMSAIPLANIYVAAASGTPKLNVEVVL